jgi:hypothetical protein
VSGVSPFGGRHRVRHGSAVATLISLLLVSVAVALIVLVLTALPNLQAGAPVLSPEGEQRTRRGVGRLLGWFGLLFARVGESVGSGMDALRNGPSGRPRRPVRQHGPDSGPVGSQEPDGEGPPSSIGPRHATR